MRRRSAPQAQFARAQHAGFLIKQFNQELVLNIAMSFFGVPVPDSHLYMKLTLLFCSCVFRVWADFLLRFIHVSPENILHSWIGMTDTSVSLP